MANSERKIGRKTDWGRTPVPKRWVDLSHLFDVDTRRESLNRGRLHKPDIVDDFPEDFMITDTGISLIEE